VSVLVAVASARGTREKSHASVGPRPVPSICPSGRAFGVVTSQSDHHGGAYMAARVSSPTFGCGKTPRRLFRRVALPRSPPLRRRRAR
jgi:hypothetical protein